MSLGLRQEEPFCAFTEHTNGKNSLIGQSLWFTFPESATAASHKAMLRDRTLAVSAAHLDRIRPI